MEGLKTKSFSSYQEAVQWITGLAKFGMKPGLERMQALMEKLGHPERRLKFIHVAGTNGKGSTCAFLGKFLQMSGYDVGSFTSPYMEKFTNRIKYNGTDIPEEDVLALTNQLVPLAAELSGTEYGAPTQFEICTALALLYFARMTFPDYVVWETGLGGRLDSTNIVIPVLTVITNIGHDHMDILGNSIEAIAREKAGIVKAGVPLVSAVEQPEAVRVLEEVCREKKSTLYLMGRNFKYREVFSGLNRQVFDFSGPFRQIPGLEISMNGRHQFKNAALAVMALEVLRQYYALIVEDDILQQALKATVWPGRLEMISDQPRLLLDGAHNPEGAEALAHAILETYRPERLHLMLGMLASKEHRGILRHLLPLADTIIATQPDFRNPLPAERLAAIVEEELAAIGRRAEVRTERDWKKALEQLKASTGPADLGVVTGTLYMISDVRSWLLYGTDSEKGW